jgi:multidrug resistance efflux pump
MARRSKLITWGLPLLALLAGAGAAISIARNQPVKAPVSPVVSPPMQPAVTGAGRSQGFIGAAGLVEPAGQEIDVGAHVSGVLADVFVVPGDHVAAGAPLFALDERSAAAQLALRRAELAAAEKRLEQTLARVPTLQAQLTAARAAVAAVKAELEDWQDQTRSADALRAKGDSAISDREVTRRRNAERAARGRLAEAEARAAQAEAELDLVARAERAPTVEVERANVAQARQAVARAEVDLALLTVRAPRDATVLQVNVRPGEFALAGALTTPLMVLGRLDPLHVRVDIDEVDIGLFEPGARAYASLRGQAARRIELTFVRVDPLVVPKRSLTGAGIERVDTRVLRVVYAMQPGTAGAYPGQQVDVFIATAPAPAATAATGSADAPPQ